MTLNIPSITLNDGHTLPAIGFGTYPLKGVCGLESIVSAIDVGYRLLDSAFNYENEGTVGQAIRRSGISRDALRITSKLPGRHHQHAKATATIEESLYRAQLDYYDLYLIHWPNPAKGLYVEAWQAMIDAQKRGLIRSIGVCNFLPDHLETLKAETGIVPAVNQIELHPRFPQEAQRAADQRYGVITQSWSPLGRASDILQDPVITAIAQRHGKTIAQVILRWHVQCGALPLPKAGSRERQVENLSIFDFTLNPNDIAAISGLARPDGRIAGQDPATYEEF